ncbi:MAG TPA: hypothetical protein DEA96_14085 [Leptospiraceae bacterium]|nr:hypothetical protein [Spirochaetaceae bacterium]HBS06092.1 hypothetical protein [Leptospiraceae bacterium]|tara:strand:+ start:59721 stop:60122 length:402 start_codon:yes stop_codon:yes gene_type:complete
MKQFKRILLLGVLLLPVALLARDVKVLLGTNQGNLCASSTGPAYLENINIPMDTYFQGMEGGNWVRNGKWKALAVIHEGGRVVSTRVVWEGYPTAFKQNGRIQLGTVKGNECLVIHSLSPASNMAWFYRVHLP